MNNNQDKKDKVVVNSFTEGVNFMLCTIFFLITLVFTIQLTDSIVNMADTNGDTNAENAKNLMISAVTFSYIIDFFIIITFLSFYTYSVTQPDKYNSTQEKINNKIGGQNIYISIRIVIFTALMLLSILMSSLVFAAAGEIDKSDNPDLYSDQYNMCMDLGRSFMIRFILFTFVQVIVFLIKACIDMKIIPAKAVKTLTPDQ